MYMMLVLSLKTEVFSGILGCMNNRSYNQFCSLAYALDRVGDRWTLLIIREPLTGPRRFKDLLDGLPEISTNLLAGPAQKPGAGGHPVPPRPSPTGRLHRV